MMDMMDLYEVDLLNLIFMILYVILLYLLGLRLTHLSLGLLDLFLFIFLILMKIRVIIFYLFILGQGMLQVMKGLYLQKLINFYLFDLFDFIILFVTLRNLMILQQYQIMYYFDMELVYCLHFSKIYQNLNLIDLNKNYYLVF